jgi:hypothetical protein
MWLAPLWPEAVSEELNLNNQQAIHGQKQKISILFMALFYISFPG